jgi:hypothetical protein
MTMEYRIFIGIEVGASLIKEPAPYPKDGYKDREEALYAAEEFARTKGKKGATVGLFAREDHAKCYAICGWKVVEEGNLRTLPVDEVEQTLQVTAADFGIPQLGKGDIETFFS